MPGSNPATMPSQRSFFLTNFFTALRQQTTTPSMTAAVAVSSSQPNKHQATAAAATSSAQASSAASPSTQPSNTSYLPIHSPRTGGAIPIPNSHNRRRGSDSSSEGFRDVLGADKWYVGGRTAAGEEKFFKLGVVRRVRSGDRLSLDRLSL